MRRTRHTRQIRDTTVGETRRQTHPAAHDSRLPSTYLDFDGGPTRRIHRNFLRTPQHSPSAHHQRRPKNLRLAGPHSHRYLRCMVELDPKLLTGGELKRFQVARYRRVRHVHSVDCPGCEIETLERCDFSFLQVPQERVGVLTRKQTCLPNLTVITAPRYHRQSRPDRPGRDWRERQGVYASSRPLCRKTRIGAGTRRCISSWTISVPSQSQVGSG